MTAPLFLTERECADWLGFDDVESFHVAAKVWERHGFPAIDPRTNRRYAPAIRAWWDRQYARLIDKAAPMDQGEEDLDYIRSR